MGVGMEWGGVCVFGNWPKKAPDMLWETTLEQGTGEAIKANDLSTKSVCVRGESGGCLEV